MAHSTEIKELCERSRREIRELNPLDFFLDREATEPLVLSRENYFATPIILVQCFTGFKSDFPSVHSNVCLITNKITVACAFCFLRNSFVALRSSDLISLPVRIFLLKNKKCLGELSSPKHRENPIHQLLYTLGIRRDRVLPAQGQSLCCIH